MQKIIKKAEVAKSIKSFNVSEIRLQNAGLLAQAVNSVLSAYGEKKPQPGSTNKFFPAPHQRPRYQGIVYSSGGATIVPNLATLMKENFILTLNDIEVASETVSEKQRTMLGLRGITAGRKIPAIVNGGWFEKEATHGVEYCFLLIVQKPEFVFNRYTLMGAEQFDAKQLAPPVARVAPAAPAGRGSTPPAQPEQPQNFPVMILDPYTRANFHYPQIFAKDFYDCVFAQYCTQPLDRYVVSKTRAVLFVGENAPNPLPLKKLGSQTDTLTSESIKRKYAQNLQFIQPNLNAVDIMSAANDDVYEQMEEASELGKDSAEGGPTKNLADLQRELKQLKDSQDPDIATDPDDARQIARLESLIANFGSVGEDELNPVVFTFGQPTPKGNSLYETQLKSPAVRTALETTESSFSTITSTSKGRSMLNYLSLLASDIVTSYVPAGVTSDILKEFEGGIFAINLKIGGIYRQVLDRNGNPTETHKHASATPEVSAAVAFPHGHRVERPYDFYAQIMSYFPDVLKAENISEAGTGETIDYSKAYSESVETESISLRYESDISDLKKKIIDAIEDSKKYHYFIPGGMPGETNIGKKDANGRIVGRTKKRPLQYITELQEYLYDITEISPKDLRTLNEILSSKDGFAKVKETDISLIRIIKEEI